jgi:hypothetical protein
MEKLTHPPKALEFSSFSNKTTSLYMKKSTKKASPAENKPAAAPKTKAAPRSDNNPAPAPTPSAVKRATAPRAKKSAASETAVVANVDVGFGNRLFIRGDAPGLSWERGTLMECVNHDIWQWTTAKATAPFACKLLLNDENWSHGEDFQVAPGERKEVRPSF